MEAAKIKNDLGTISIADQVIAVFAREAALDTTGIIGMDDRYSHGISSVISEEDAEGVRVSVKEIWFHLIYMYVSNMEDEFRKLRYSCKNPSRKIFIHIPKLQYQKLT